MSYIRKVLFTNKKIYTVKKYEQTHPFRKETKIQELLNVFWLRLQDIPYPIFMMDPSEYR